MLICCIFMVNFGRMVYIRQWWTTFLQNFTNISQSTALLLRFVKKYKMATAAILNEYFIIFYHPQNPFVYRKLRCKFRVDRICISGDIAIWKFHKFGLKCVFGLLRNYTVFLEFCSFETFWPIITKIGRKYSCCDVTRQANFHFNRLEKINEFVAVVIIVQP